MLLSCISSLIMGQYSYKQQGYYLKSNSVITLIILLHCFTNIHLSIFVFSLLRRVTEVYLFKLSFILPFFSVDLESQTFMKHLKVSLSFELNLGAFLDGRRKEYAWNYILCITFFVCAFTERLVTNIQHRYYLYCTVAVFVGLLEKNILKRRQTWLDETNNNNKKKSIILANLEMLKESLGITFLVLVYL